MRLVSVVFTFENNTGQTDRQTDKPTDGPTDVIYVVHSFFYRVHFLDAFRCVFYKRVCPSVGPSVRPSVIYKFDLLPIGSPG